MSELSTPPSRERRPGTVFGVVVGFLLGALVAALTLPDHGATTIRQATGGEVAAGSGEGTSTDGVSAEGTTDTSTLDGGGATASGGATSSGGSDGGSGGAAAPSSGAGGEATATEGGGSGAAAPPPATGRGVTSNKIVVGVAVPDLGALRALGPEYDNGDVPAQWRALMAGYRKEGKLPVAGRDIELRFASYDVVQQTAQRGACAKLVSDDKVFVVIGAAYFAVGADCVAREYRTPMLTSDGPLDSAFARGAPFLFSIGMSESRMWRNFVHWADARKLLRGKRVGIYYLEDPLEREIVHQVLKPEMAKLGVKPVVEASTDQALGGPRDALAARQFNEKDVQVAILLTSKAGFMQQAAAQGYKPERYIDNDHAFGTSDTTAKRYTASQFDGALGFSGRRVGMSAAGRKLTAAQEACLARYDRYSGGDKVQRPTGANETAEFAYVLTSCDLGEVLLGALRSAGAGLTPQSFVAGVESLGAVPMLRYADARFGPGKHHGGEYAHTVEWRASCTCWVSIAPFEALRVP